MGSSNRQEQQKKKKKLELNVRCLIPGLGIRNLEIFGTQTRELGIQELAGSLKVGTEQHTAVGFDEAGSPD